MAALVLQASSDLRKFTQALPESAQAGAEAAKPEPLLSFFDLTLLRDTPSDSPPSQGRAESTAELHISSCSINTDGTLNIQEHPPLEGRLRLFSKPALAASEKHGWYVFLPALPPTMSTAEVMHLFDSVTVHVSELLLVRTSNLSVVLRCRSDQSAKEVMSVYNGHPLCAGSPDQFCMIFVDQFLFVDATAIASLHASLGLRREFPVCPRCLSRLDSSCDEFISAPDGPAGVGSSPHWPPFQCASCCILACVPTCHACPSQRALWVCLVCAYVGCSRRQHTDTTPAPDLNGHSLGHYEATGRLHGFAVDARTLEVWDYRADKYVHRTREMRGPGKQLEDPDKPPVEVNKQDQLATEYVTLLEAQLGAQATYFNDQRRLLDESFSEREQAELARIAAADKALAPLQAAIAARRAAAEERQAAARTATAGFMAAMSELRTVKLETDVLRKQQGEHRDALAREGDLKAADCRRIDQEIAALREQLSDLETHFTTTREIERAPPQARAALESGQLVLGPGDSPGGSGTPSRRGRRAKRA